MLKAPRVSVMYGYMNVCASINPLEKREKELVMQRARGGGGGDAGRKSYGIAQG